jgi:vacuolar-type H+-ATPase subunit E/Vma4
LDASSISLVFATKFVIKTCNLVSRVCQNIYINLKKVDKYALTNNQESKGRSILCRESSKLMNVARLKVLQAQHDLVQGMKDAAERQLVNVSLQPNAYVKLLDALIIQVFH